MRKYALPVTVGTLVVSIFGAFFRWLQNLNAFEKDTGLPIPGAGTARLFLLYSILAAAVLCAAVLLGLRRCEKPKTFAAAFRCRTVLPGLIGWGCGVLFALCGVLILFAAKDARFPILQRAFGAAGILAGFCFPALAMKKNAEAPGPFGRPAGVYLSVFYCFWLIFCYRTHSEDPVVWGYAVETLAVAAACAAVYYAVEALYGRGRGSRAMIAGGLGIYLNLAALFDARSTAVTLMMGVTAVMLLMAEYLLLCNLKEPEAAPSDDADREA